MYQKIYVGNLSHAVTEKEIAAIFGQYGSIGKMEVIRDRDVAVGFTLVGFCHDWQHPDFAAKISQLTGWDIYTEESGNEGQTCQCCGGGRHDPMGSWDLCLPCSNMRCYNCGTPVVPIERTQLCEKCRSTE